MNKAAGFSLVEGTVVLMVAAFLAATLAPVSKSVADRARLVRAEEDGGAIRDALRQFLFDVRRPQQIKTGGKNHNKGEVVMLLVGDGDIPREASPTGSDEWMRPVSGDGVVDFLERHLVTNDPAGDSSEAWSTPKNFHSNGRGWRGGYLDGPVQPDPWGNRYAVNTEFLGHKEKPSVVVLSAGPDEVVDTAFAQKALTAGGDDIVVFVE